MELSANSMIIAKDQFFSWAMISARQLELPYPGQPAVRYSFFQARYAIFHSLKLLGVLPGDVVLVPSYICRAALDPVIAYGAEIDFYDVSGRCSVSADDLERRISRRTRGLMVVHYFGFPQPLREIRRLCDAHGIALVEDCAHVLCGQTGGEPMGSIGDASVFSWRKFLPIYDGGELILNRHAQTATIPLKKESALFTLKVAANTLDARLVHAREPWLQVAYRGVRAGEALFRRCVNSHMRRIPMMQAESTSLSFDAGSTDWPMSRVSRWTMMHSNIERIVAKRRRNYQALLGELSGTDGVKPLFTELPTAVCPWVFPVVFPRLRNAHLALRSQGIPAVTWGGVRHPQVPLNQFKEAEFLYENLIFLPVHQSLCDEDILRMSNAVKQLCRK